VNRKDRAFWERQQQTPLYAALTRHTGRSPRPFHVPGHKGGRSFDPEGLERFSAILPLDLTEITGLDDLHQAEGVIAAAEALAAEAFEAEMTRFLVAGSTVGNIALIMTICRPGEKILVQRNSHKSVFHGIMLAQARPVYIVPAIDPDTGIAACLRREDVERALQAHPDAKALFLTNPTYYGMGTDLAKMALLVHRYNIPLLVDEAHGAHYGFHPALPPSAMQSGADAAVQSTHKTGTSMTMTSMLHVQGERINRERLGQVLAMLQSSSPSYPLMASLDLARRHMVFHYAAEAERILPQLALLRERLSRLPWLGTAVCAESSVYSTLDPFKLLLSLRSGQLNGYQLQARLEERGIFPELAQTGHLLLAASTGTSPEDLEWLWRALEEISAGQAATLATLPPSGLLASAYLREQAVPMEAAVYAGKRLVELEQAEGLISAEMVIPYPPGIPLLAPGERIDADAIAVLRELRAGGARFHGVTDGRLERIAVLEKV